MGAHASKWGPEYPDEEEEPAPAPAPVEEPLVLPALPTAHLIGRGAVAVARGRGDVHALHGNRKCWGKVRAVGGSEARRHWAELVLAPEESIWLARTGGCAILDADGTEMTAEELRARADADVADKARFTDRINAFDHFRTKGWVVKCGMQFGGDFVLYRGPPDEFHAEYVVLVEPKGAALPWLRLKAVARLAADVRKHLVVAFAPDRERGGDVDEILVDDAFARPADAVAGKRRAAVQKGAAAHAKMRKRPGDPEPASPPPAKKRGKKSK
mmetsp:Transcript_19078/g.58719  ORF Transcript_19078/g.58719 Transcript_19078/m.58719 type:complete len:271 (+) Transcript_19078:1162-1974(+)